VLSRLAIGELATQVCTPVARHYIILLFSFPELLLYTLLHCNLSLYLYTINLEVHFDFVFAQVRFQNNEKHTSRTMKVYC
jgi:hypothetical protein